MSMATQSLPSFRLYIIGRVQDGSIEHTLTTFVEYSTARGLSRIQINKADFDHLLGQIRNLKSFIEAGAPEFEKGALKDLGRRLLEILLVQRTRDLFFSATGERAPGALLPLEIIAEDPEVAAWPWEYLYDPGTEKFISQEFHPISRSIFTSTKPLPCAPIEGKVRILLILGVPPDDLETTPREEIKHIYDVFSAHLDDDRFEIEILNADEYQNLLTKLTSGKKYDIVHYFGHAGFDYNDRQGYLSIRRPGKDKFMMGAETFAQILRDRGIRLVFLNACKTAVGDPTENPARSSIAAALLDRGIPAVIASQFSLPDNSAHFLAATIYNTLLTGKPIGDAIRDGRSAMWFADKAKFLDWGIPVLYSTDPSQVILPKVGRKPKWADEFTKAAESGNLIETLATSGRPGAPSLVAERTRSKRNKDAKYNVALLDIDAKVGFLADLADAANRAQKYYQFEVCYLPVPSGYARSDLSEDVQTFLPRLAPVLDSTPRSFSVDYVCCLTRNMVATEEDSSLFAAALPGNDKVIAVSTFHLREYAAEAGVTFEKAVLSLCISMLVQADPRWTIEFHEETVGCPFDYCGQRDDIVVGLRKMKFDHEDCRRKIHDPDQLAAIDAILASSYSRDSSRDMASSS